MPTEVQPNYSTTITTGGLDILVAVTCSTVPEDYLPTDPKRCAKYFQKLIQDARDTFTGQ